MQMSRTVRAMTITALVLLLASLMACGSQIRPPQGMPAPPEGFPMPSFGDPGTTVKSGKPARAAFWVTIPHNTPPQDVILLSIEGQEPVQMNQVGELSWEIVMNVATGDVINYKYLRGSASSFSSQYQVEITAENQKIFDGVAGWNDLPFTPQFQDDFAITIYMFDTWGRNYNFNMFEDTRKNIASSFTRVAQTGVEEVYVNDFFMAVYGEGHRMGSTNYDIEEEIFENDYRDEVMTQDDLDKLAKEAKANGLKIGWRSSMHFVEIGKYIGSPNITAEVAKDWDG